MWTHVPAKSCAEDDEPLDTRLGVEVEAGSVGRVSDGTNDKGELDGGDVDEGRVESTGDDHEGEGETVGRVYGAWVLGATGTEGGHGTPDTGGEEGAHAKDCRLCEGGAEPASLARVGGLGGRHLVAETEGLADDGLGGGEGGVLMLLLG